MRRHPPEHPPRKLIGSPSKLRVMTPLAFLTTTALTAFALFQHTATAQIVQTRFDKLPVTSDIYRQTVNVYVYTTPAAPADAVALPVVYVPLVQQKDTANLTLLEGMMQEGAMPYMRIVAIERLDKAAPAAAAAAALYADPKGYSEGESSADAWFCQFIDREVIPAMEAKYKCNTFRALYIDESCPLGAYLLKNHLRGFSAYLSPTPFVWFNEDRRPGSAGTFIGYYSGLQGKEAILAAAEREGAVEEYFLKMRKATWQKE